MANEIKWQPNVCSCVIMQCRYSPDTNYEFAHKCELHSGLSDADARADIISLCIAASAALENSGN